MRSVGKVNIKKLKKIVAEEIKKHTTVWGGTDYQSIEEAVKARIPDEWYDIWESAWSEIERLIGDELTAHAHRRI